MTNLLTPKRKSIKRKVTTATAAITFVATLFAISTYFINQWFDNNRFVFQQPIHFSIHLQAPVFIQKRVYLSPMASPSAKKKEVVYIDPDGVYEFNTKEVKAYVRQENNKKFGDKYWQYLEELLTREANFRVVAQNPESSAFGMFQFLDTTWNNYNCQKTVRLKQQVDCGLAYIEARYGNPAKAWDFWQEHSWY